MFNDDFYPTPYSLADKMVYKHDIRTIKTVLEPSAGRGDLADRILQRMISNNGGSYNKEYKPDIDVIELDQNLRHILKGKGYRIVHDDFLTYNTYKQYDLIISNPPFSTGDLHLLKILEMQKNGGKIVCLLNAETLKNPYTVTRKDLIQKLDEYNASIEYIDDAFKVAERRTDIQIALISVDIPKVQKPSYIFEKLRQSKSAEQEKETQYSLINGDMIKGIVEQYNFEVNAGVELIREYEAMAPYMLRSFTDSYQKDPILKLSFHDCDRYSTDLSINEFIRRVRMKYWKALFENKDFMGLLTSNLRDEYYRRVETLADYDFSQYNIYSLRVEMNANMMQSVEDTILNLFDEFSNKHHYYDEMSKNIWMYSGWKTNSAYKINKKVIIPYTANIRRSYNYVNGEQVYYKYFDGTGIDKLRDAEKVFNYLDGGLTDEISIDEALKAAAEEGITKKIKLKFFTCTFFQKGTCHIEFNNLDLLDKFNIFGSQKKGWLPPSYAKKSYKNMTTEEKKVIDEFQGAEAYEKVMRNSEYFLYDPAKTLMLTSGETA